MEETERKVEEIEKKKGETQECLNDAQEADGTEPVVAEWYKCARLLTLLKQYTSKISLLTLLAQYTLKNNHPEERRCANLEIELLSETSLALFVGEDKNYNENSYAEIL